MGVFGAVDAADAVLLSHFCPLRQSRMPAAYYSVHAQLIGNMMFVTLCMLQAKEALKHPYFDDLDRVTVDALENPELQGLDDE